MTRLEAVEQYNLALKAGQKYYKASVASGGYPYPLVLDEILDEAAVVGRVELGVVNIPAESIVGTKTVGRKAALAGNFMPLLPDGSEFAAKWINLCEAHLGDEGIKYPIKCFEYMGLFYVQEGNKRTSVFKSYDAPTISAYVTRIVPEYSDELSVQVYYEFMHFYSLSGLYQVKFNRLGCYLELQTALGFQPEHVWTEDERRWFSAGFTHFSSAFERCNAGSLPISAADALLVWLQVFTFQDIKEQSVPELTKSLATVWPDIKNLVAEQPIAVSTAPTETEKGFIAKLFSPKQISHLDVAFIYAYDPSKSAWTRAHVHGQEYLERTLGDKISVKIYNVFDKNYDGAMQEAVEDGAKLIFATTPQMIAACRRIAALHNDVRVLNCSLSLPYAGIRTYYSRIYESKFITGAIAGAMAEEGVIGYVANYPIVGVPAAINAFALGARLTNPRARIKLLWSCTEGDPLLSFVESGITVISNRDATNNENEHWDLEWGTYKLQADGSLLPLAVPCWEWGRFYEKVVQSIFSGAWDALKERESERAINYWWGLNSGVIDVQLSETMPAGVRQLADFLKSGIINGHIDPFNSKIIDQAGNMRNDGNHAFSPEEIINMDWLCDNVDGHLPSYEELLPASIDTVRVLGLYRDSLPPETEE